MKPPTRSRLLLALLAVALHTSLLAADPAASTTPAGAPPPSAAPQRSAADLEKLAMPIALHPDPLISIILPAAVYPVEIVQAARFVKDTNNIPRIDDQPWDANVKSVAKFPELIAKMDADLGWTVELGQAFLEQPKELMDTIQSLRAKAHKAGTLQTSQQQIVTVTNIVVVQTNLTQITTLTNQVIQVAPSNPQVVYVPTYPSTVYYPPPAYVYDPYAPLLTFGVGIAVGAIIANNCDWHGGGIYVGGGGMVVWGGGGHSDVDINIDRDTTINTGNRPTPRSTTTSANSGARAGTAGAQPSQQKWQPDQSRLRSSGAPSTTQSREARGWGSTQSRPSQPSASNMTARPTPGTPTAASRPSPSRPPTAAQRPTAPAAPARSPSPSPWQSQGAARPSPAQSPASRPATPSPSVNRSQGGSAFSGVNNASVARSSSSRGTSSRSGGYSGASRGGGRGGGGGRR